MLAPYLPKLRGRHERSDGTTAMSSADALSASAAGPDIAACTAMLSSLTPSALRADPALAPLMEAGLKLFGPEVLPHGQSAVWAASQLGLHACPSSHVRAWTSQLGPQLAALSGSVLPGTGRPTGRPATASGARASHLQSRPFRHL